MIDGYMIMTAIRDILEADATLLGLLEEIPGINRVLLGGAPPDVAGTPVVMIPDNLWSPARNPLPTGEFSQDVNIWARLTGDGMEDFATIYPIARRINTLLNQQRIANSTTILAGVRLSIANPTVLLPEQGLSYKTLTFEGRASLVT